MNAMQRVIDQCTHLRATLDAVKRSNDESFGLTAILFI